MTDLATDTRTCPFCDETIKDEAVVCRICGRESIGASSAAARKAGGRIVCEQCGHANSSTWQACKVCARPLEAARAVVKPAPKASSKPFVIGAVVVGLLCVATLLFNGGTGAGAGGVPLLAPATTSHKVIYELTGTAHEALITVTNEQGGNEQRDVDIPYSRELTLAPRAFAYLSAQNIDEDGGRLVCRVWVDGKIWRESESSGFAKIATCSGRVGE